MSDIKSRSRSPLAVFGIDGLSSPWTRVFISLAKKMQVGQLSLVLPDGSNTVFSGSSRPVIRAVLNLHRPEAVRKVLLGGARGFGEAYMDGDWDSPDLSDLLKLAHANEPSLGAQAEGVGVALWIDRQRHRLRTNSRRGSRRNIAYHYDLGNGFYRHWLDPSMTYSSGLFHTGNESLESSQRTKYLRLADMLELRPGHRILEIGCGWGAFAVMAARDYGCHVTAITLSKEQHDYARQRAHDAGLSERIDVRLQDYRDVQGTFDRIASIEMLEAVGEEHWPRYFQIVRDRLKPGGIAGLQVITIEDGRFQTYRNGADFIQRYIFPGGMLPSPSIMQRQVEDAGLKVSDVFTFGASYARTLAIWQRRFQHAWPQIEQLGFDNRFKRMWEFYLAYCEAGFRNGSIDVAQYRIVRT